MAMNNKRSLVVIFYLALLAHQLSTTSSAEGGESEFDYRKGSSKGPDRWGDKWSICGNGKSQSPVDIEEGDIGVPTLKKLEKRYKPAVAVLKNRGHDIQVAWSGDAGSIVIDGTTYSLKQLHWHTPSEHTIEGGKFDLEMHMVHTSSTNATAVIGVLYKLGQPDVFLTKLGRAFVLLGSTKTVDLGVLDPRDAKINDRSYYRYVGSLTTPPCTEGDVWTVLTKVRTASSAEIQALQKLVDAGFQMNARPIQPLYGRTISWLYDP